MAAMFSKNEMPEGFRREVEQWVCLQCRATVMRKRDDALAHVEWHERLGS